MRPYTESYEYDGVGNILSMIHQANGGSWTRAYRYAADSNRLLTTSLPGDDPNGPYTEEYRYDLHGSMTFMPHLALMSWDFAERMQASSAQVFNDGTAETTYYVYDASGQRVRKVTERQAATSQTPARMKERVYLGGFEIYREYGGDGQDSRRWSARRCTSWTISSASRSSKPRPGHRFAAHGFGPTPALPVRQSPRLREPGTG